MSRTRMSASFDELYEAEAETEPSNLATSANGKSFVRAGPERRWRQDSRQRGPCVAARRVSIDPGASCTGDVVLRREQSRCLQGSQGVGRCRSGVFGSNRGGKHCRGVEIEKQEGKRL